MMEQKLEIDAIDRHILKILQADCGLPIQEISDRVGLSVNPCWRRIRKLEAEGVISKRVAIVDSSRLGLGVTVFVTVRTNRHDKDWLDSFARAVDQIPEIMECHRMSGDSDYFLKVQVRDIAHYDRVYKHLVELSPDLFDVSSTFSMEQIKLSSVLDPALGREG